MPVPTPDAGGPPEMAGGATPSPMMGQGADSAMLLAALAAKKGKAKAKGKRKGGRKRGKK